MPDLVLDPLDGTPPLHLAYEDGYLTPPGPVGLGLPPRAVNTTVLPGFDGVRVDSVQIAARDILVPLVVNGRDRARFLARRRRLYQIAGSRRPIRITHTDGPVTRWIDGYYVGGCEGSGAVEQSGDTWETYGIVFRCNDPWWRSNPQSITYSLQPAAAFFPIFPLRLARDSVGARRQVWVDGDEIAWPKWTVTGPGSDLTLTSYTTGQVIRTVHDLLTGQQIVIDTEPSQQTVETGAGGNLFQTLATNPPLWGLRPGINDVEVALTGAGAGATVTATWQPRYGFA